MAMRSVLSRISLARSIYSTRGAFTRVFRGDDRKADSIKDRQDLEMIGEDYWLQKDDKAETNKNDADEKSARGMVWETLMEMAGKDKGAVDKNKDVPIWWEDNPFLVYEVYKAVRDKKNKDMPIWWEDNPFLLYEAYKAVRDKKIDNLGMYDGEWLSEVDKTNMASKDLEIVGEDCWLYKEDKAETNKNAVDEKLAWAMVWETLMEMTGKDQGAADESKDVPIWWEDNPFLLYEAYKAVRDKKIDNPEMYDAEWLSEVDTTNIAIIDGDEIKDLDSVGEDYWPHEDDKAERNKNAADKKSTWGMVWEKLMKMAGKDQGAVNKKPEGAHRG